MSRNSKPLALQKGNLTQEQQLRKKQQESLIVVGKEDLYTPPDWLINDTARTEFARLVREFDKIDMIGNLDLNNLVAYCNSYAMYRGATEKLNPDNVTTVDAPMIKIQQIYAEEMRKFGTRVGLDITSRLKSASEKIDKEIEHIDNTFGDI